MDDYYEELRQFLINECEAMYFAGGIGSAIIDISRIEEADNEELEEIAKELGIDIEDPKIKERII